MDFCRISTIAIIVALVITIIVFKKMWNFVIHIMRNLPTKAGRIYKHLDAYQQNLKNCEFQIPNKKQKANPIRKKVE